MTGLQKRNTKKKIQNYVCPFCFNQIKNCTCDLAPHTLLMIDNGLQYAIRELNNKHWFTVDCCEGHYEDQIPNTYISFVRPIKLKIIPNGFVLESNNVIRKIYNKGKKEDFLREKEEIINSLNKWVDSLEGR